MVARPNSCSVTVAPVVKSVIISLEKLASVTRGAMVEAVFAPPLINNLVPIATPAVTFTWYDKRYLPVVFTVKIVFVPSTVISADSNWSFGRGTAVPANATVTALPVVLSANAEVAVVLVPVGPVGPVAPVAPVAPVTPVTLHKKI